MFNCKPPTIQPTHPTTHPTPSLWMADDLPSALAWSSPCSTFAFDVAVVFFIGQAGKPSKTITCQQHNLLHCTCWVPSLHPVSVSLTLHLQAFVPIVIALDNTICMCYKRQDSLWAYLRDYAQARLQRYVQYEPVGVSSKGNSCAAQPYSPWQCHPVQ